MVYSLASWSLTWATTVVKFLTERQAHVLVAEAVLWHNGKDARTYNRAFG